MALLAAVILWHFLTAYYRVVIEWKMIAFNSDIASRVAISQKPHFNTFAANNKVEAHWGSCLYDYCNLLIIFLSQWISGVQDINELHVGKQTFPWKVSISIVVGIGE